jgi:hypothetical protein
MNEPIRFEVSMSLDERVKLQINMVWAIPAFRRQRYQSLAVIPLAAWFLLPSVRDAVQNPLTGFPIIAAVVFAVGFAFVLGRALESRWYRKRLKATYIGDWPLGSEWVMAEDELELIADDGSHSTFRHSQLQSVQRIGEHLVFQWRGRYTAQAHHAQVPTEALARMRAAAPLKIPWPDDAA